MVQLCHHPHYTPSFFRSLAWLFGKGTSKNSLFPIRAYLSLFGASPHIVWIVWNKIRIRIAEDAKPLHLLCTLLFLKTYETESVLSVMTGLSPKTMRKWVRHFTEVLSSLNEVCLLSKAHQCLGNCNNLTIFSTPLDSSSRSS